MDVLSLPLSLLSSLWTLHFYFGGAAQAAAFVSLSSFTVLTAYLGVCIRT